MSARARAKFRAAEFAYPHPHMSWLARQRGGRAPRIAVEVGTPGGQNLLAASNAIHPRKNASQIQTSYQWGPRRRSGLAARTPSDG